MKRYQHLLVSASEECAETSQRFSKALKFGLNEIQAGQPLTNAERIVYEFNDLLAIMEMMEDEGLIHTVRDPIAIELKKAKIEKWFKYSEELGLLTK